MLNRVRDFRYEDIKNWKPLVSLRESYRKETGIRNMVLVGICILAVLFGYSVLNGSIQFTGKLIAARPSAPNLESPNGDVPSNSVSFLSHNQTSDSYSPDSASNARISELPSRSGANIQAEKIPVVGSPPRAQTNPHQLVDHQQDWFSNTTNQTTRNDASRPSVPKSKIAVCDVQRIVSRDAAYLTNQLKAAAEKELRDHQEFVLNRAGHFSDADLFILEGLFEQKKEIAAAKIREETQQYREAIEQQLRPIADRIAHDNNFDLVLTTDQVLSFTETSDITTAVQREWFLQRQKQQTARNLELGSR